MGAEYESGLQALFELQNIYLSIDRLNYKIENLKGSKDLIGLGDSIEELKKQMKEYDFRLSELKADQLAKDEKLKDLYKHIEILDKALHERYDNLPKDQASIAQELERCKMQAKDLEDEDLFEMAEIDELETKLGELTKEISKLTDIAESKRAEIANAIRETETQIDSQLAKIADLEAQISQDMLARFKKLRENGNLIAIAKIEGNRCENCHIELSDFQLNEMKKLGPGNWATCEECGTILVRNA